MEFTFFVHLKNNDIYNITIENNGTKYFHYNLKIKYTNKNKQKIEDFINKVFYMINNKNDDILELDVSFEEDNVKFTYISGYIFTIITENTLFEFIIKPHDLVSQMEIF